MFSHSVSGLQDKHIIHLNSSEVIELTSTNYPNSYDFSTYQEWIFHGVTNYSILFVVDDFHVENDYDYVNVGVGANPGDDNSRVVEMLTGERAPFYFTVGSDVAWVTFTSDSTNVKRGFRFEVSLVPFNVSFTCPEGQLECTPFQCVRKCDGNQDCNIKNVNDELNADCSK